MGTGSGAYEPERVPIFYYRDKTRVQLFYVDSNTTVLLQCVALVFLGKRMTHRIDLYQGLTVLQDSCKTQFCSRFCFL